MTIEPSVGIQAFERTDRNSLQNNELDVFPELLMQLLVLSVPACRWHVGLGEALPNQEGVNGHRQTGGGMAVQPRCRDLTFDSL